MSTTVRVAQAGRAAEPAPADDSAAPTAQSRRAFEELFAEHAPAVYAYARRRCTAADAEEVVADTFLVAWRRSDAVPADARPWLLAVARRTLANRQRGDARRHALQARVASQPEVASDEDRATTDVNEPVLRALAALPRAEYDALTLLAWDGLAPNEIATVLGCSRAAVYLRLSRARRRVRDALTSPRTEDLP